MLEFNSLNGLKPKKEKIKNKHITDTRPTKQKRNKKKTIIKNNNTVVNNNNIALTTQISVNHEEKVDGIIAYINSLPQQVQDLIKNANLKTVVARQGYSMYVLDNKLTIKIKDERLGNKNYLRIIVSQGKQQLFNNRV